MVEGVFGRDTEMQIFDKLCRSKKSELLAVYGRRRIGKTFLISQYFQDKGVYFEITGEKDAGLEDQLQNFAKVYADVFYQGLPQTPPKSWKKAFELLRKKFASVDQNRKIILFFDELPWLVSSRSRFLQALDYYWNRYWSRDPRMIVIVCGSAASWMIHHVLHDKGGLHGRVTKTIRMFPFNLSETEEFLKKQNVVLNRKQLVEIYMALGGVARYLTFVEPGKSATQVINDVCFSAQGELFKEFNKLYYSLFDQAPTHIEIVKALAKKHSGLNRKELFQKTNLTHSGSTTKILEELVEAGFLMEIPFYQKQSRGMLFLLCDEYSLFFIDWISKAPNTSIEGIEKDYWIKKQNSQAYKTWTGFAFEMLCLKHITQIKQALSIGGVSSQSYCWYDPQKKAQIDLIIDRDDGCINLCEIKFHNLECKLTQKDVQSLQTKRDVFVERTKTKKTIFPTLITAYGAKEDKNYHQVVTHQLSLEALFSKL